MSKKRIITLFAGALLCAASAFALEGSVYRDSLETAKGPACNPAELLRGRISGLRVSSQDGNVNGETSANIRGINTLRGDSQPLWIVDGAILTTAGNLNSDAFWQYPEMSYSSTINTMAYLSAYDIESIEVIKDMSAAALYGGNAANGVVVIRTKTPANRDNTVSYNGNAVLGVSNVNADIFTPSFSHNHSVSVSGSQNGSSYRVSGYMRCVDGIVANQDATFGGVSVNFESRANSALQFGFHNIISKGATGNATGPAYFGQPSLMMLGRAPYLFPLNSGEGWNRDYDDDTDDTRTTNSMFLAFNFTRKLSLDLKVGADYRSHIRKIWFGDGTSFGAEMNGAASIMNSSLFNYNASATLSYKSFVGKTGSLRIDAGADGLGYINRFNTMNGFDFFTHALRAEGLSIMGSHADICSYDALYGTLGAFGRVRYEYGAAAGGEVSYRIEKSPSVDCFAPSSYPSASVWINLKSILFRETELLSSARLTAGYGVGGRDNYIPYQLLSLWSATSIPTFETGQDSYVDGFDRVRSGEYNVGMSLGAFGDRITASVKYFDKSTTEEFLIFDRSEKDSYGYFVESDRREVYSQTAGIEGRGFEVELGAVPVKAGRTRWDLGLNFTACSNQVTALDDSQTYGKNVGDGMCVTANAVGFQVGNLYGYLENADGSYRDMNGDGLISSVDKRLLGNTAPKFYGGFSSAVTFGNLSVDILLDGAAGHRIGNLNSVVLDRKTDLSESYVEKGDFLRLSHLAVSYDLMVKSKIVKSAKITLSARNLLTLSGYSGWNPDVNCFGRSAFTQGLDYGSYPVTRNIVLGVNLNF